jgi:hypothetical protein
VGRGELGENVYVLYSEMNGFSAHLPILTLLLVAEHLSFLGVATHLDITSARAHSMAAQVRGSASA